MQFYMAVILVLVFLHFICVIYISGDIGGQVGLFLGASILTLLEFIDFVARILSRKFKRKINPEHTA